MNLCYIDWIVVGVIMSALLVVGLSTRQYTRSVTDFLAADRCAGRYLLTLAEGAAGLGLVSIVAYWEMYYNTGFSGLWWGAITVPIPLFLALSGWVTYRYRQTRALTMAEFFEMRYSRKFRIFAGSVAWFSGILNYGIFPAVTSRCLIYFLGIPVYSCQILGIELNLTMAIVMFIMLTVAVLFALCGGQISVMFTDFFQGQLFNVAFLTALVALLVKIGWGTIIETLTNLPVGQPKINPFDQDSVQDFNIWYFLLTGFLIFYGYRVWQGSQGYNCSAKSPHEARMAVILSTWRGIIINLLYVFAPVCVFVVLNNPDFKAVADEIKLLLQTITQEQMREQITVSVSLTRLLPVGVLGLMASSLIAAAISTDDTYLHSWGSIFIQDVIIPLRKKPLSTKQHLKYLRISIVGVAIFAWFFSMLFPLREYILMYFQITGAIYLGGAGAVIVGGLYWKRATTCGAWAGMIVGSILSVSGIVLRNICWPKLHQFLNQNFSEYQWVLDMPEKFPLNGIEVAFYAAIIAILTYIIVSLFTKPNPNFSLDKMLHRGIYSLEEHIVPTVRSRFVRALGISDEFTKGDIIIFFSTLAFSMFWFIAFVIGCIINAVWGISIDSWCNWWLFKMLLSGILAVGTLIWFLIGGIRDLRESIRLLKRVDNISSDAKTEKIR